jgi:hypothetical protein
VQEEHNMVPLAAKDAFYCVYRTTRGFPCHAYTYDGCRTWTRPELMTYTPGGRPMRTPRACPMVWRTLSGKYLFWYHHNGGKGYTDNKNLTGSARNPVWISGGIERDGKIHWSQPEILLFDPNIKHGMSYPDLIEQDGQFWVTETQKTIARVHPVDRSLLEGLWNQGRVKSVAREGLLVEAGPEQIGEGQVNLPVPLELRKTGGMAIDLWVKPGRWTPGQAIIDARAPDRRGFALVAAKGGALRFEVSDGSAKASWDTDPGLLTPGQWHHAVAIADTGAGVLSFVVDGLLCDGGTARECGWTRMPVDVSDVGGAGVVRIPPALRSELGRLRIYSRYLRTSEAVANYHAGR